MANPETNPFKSLGIDPSTIKAIEAAGGVEAVKRFIEGYKRAVSRDLHPDKTTSPTAHEKLLDINNGTADIADSPDMLVSQWVKGIRSKPKAPIAIPQLQTTKPNQIFDSLVKLDSSRHQFWKPAKYLVQTSIRISEDKERVLSDRHRVITNDGQNLHYQNANDVSETTGHTRRTTINQHIERAKVYSGLTEILQSNPAFNSDIEHKISRKALLEIKPDGSSILNNGKFTEQFYDVIDEDPEELFSKAGFYGLQLDTTETVERRLANLRLDSKPGPALMITFPSIELVNEPQTFEGLVIGFVGKNYLEVLARFRQEMLSGSNDQLVKEILPGEGHTHDGSVRLRDEELPILEEFYLSELDVSSYKSRDAELLVSRMGQATLMGSITKVIPTK